MSMDKARALFRKNNVGLDGNIKTEEIGNFMKAAGLSPTPAEILHAHRTLDPRDTGSVVFSDLENWLSDLCLVQKRSQYNRLLVKPVVGKAKRQTYDVPGAAHTYGAPVTRDEVSGKDLLFNWKEAQPSKSSDAYVDRVKMNRVAVQKGCVSAKDFVQHGQTERIYTYAREKPKAQVVIDKTQAFGQKPLRSRARAQPSVADLITAKFNDAMFDEEGEYPKITSKNASPASRRQHNVAGSAPFSTEIVREVQQPGKTYRHTKASRLQAQKTREAAAPEEKKVFTLKQFRNVRPRVNTHRTTGSDIVSNAGY